MNLMSSAMGYLDSRCTYRTFIDIHLPVKTLLLLAMMFDFTGVLTARPVRKRGHQAESGHQRGSDWRHQSSSWMNLQLWKMIEVKKIKVGVEESWFQLQLKNWGIILSEYNNSIYIYIYGYPYVLDFEFRWSYYVPEGWTWRSGLQQQRFSIVGMLLLSLGCEWRR